MSLRVTSEIGKLKSVLVHLPGPEIDRMVPSMMEELLFDDILYGNRAREEHRRFQQVLGFVADEVLEVQDLLEEVLQVPEQRGAVLDDLARTFGWGGDMEVRLRDLNAEQLASALITGIERPLPEIAEPTADLYAIPPIPNYFFQRDPLVVVGERAIRCSMATSARQREPLLNGYVLSLHPRFASAEGGKFWFQEFSANYGKPASYARMRPTLEGGDILVLREDLLAIGYSERTEKTTIERLAESFKKLKAPVKRILVVAIPPARSYMHLDTVFTMI
jgi:arginine deiminase